MVYNHVHVINRVKSQRSDKESVPNHLRNSKVGNQKIDAGFFFRTEGLAVVGAPALLLVVGLPACRL